MVGLSREPLQRYPSEFSGGPRIAIARALAAEPQLRGCWIASSGLQPSISGRFRGCERSMSVQLGCALQALVFDATAILGPLCKGLTPWLETH